MYSFKVFIILFILSLCFVSSNEIYTRTQLRGLYHQNMNKMLSEEIQRIVETVVASAKNNGTSYSERYLIPNAEFTNVGGILVKFSDKIIINRLKNILIDSNITISGPKCCSIYDHCAQHINPLCKFIDIIW